MSRKQVFVGMPFGWKTGPAGQLVNFDKHVYEPVFETGIKAADLEPIRADKLLTPGHHIGDQIYKSIQDCDFALFDITWLNPNVMFELGVRLTMHRGHTLIVSMHGSGTSYPFDIGTLAILDYKVGELGPASADELANGADLGTVSNTDVSQTLKFDADIARESANKITNWCRNLDHSPDWQGSPAASPIYRALPYFVTSNKSPIFGNNVYHSYPLKDDESRTIGVVTGDIVTVDKADAIVNSENDEFSMARPTEKSVSAQIRLNSLEYMNDDRSRTSEPVVRELAKAYKKMQRHVQLGRTVIITGAGGLSRRGFRHIVHVASVTPNTDTHPRFRTNIPTLVNSMRAVLENISLHNSKIKRDNPRDKKRPIRSVAVPLMGTGDAGMEPGRVAVELVQEAVRSFRGLKDPYLKHIYFVGYDVKGFLGIAEALRTQGDIEGGLEFKLQDYHELRNLALRATH